MRRGSKRSPKWSILESLAVLPMPTSRKKIGRNWMKKEKNVSSLDTVMSQKAITFISPDKRNASSQGTSYSMKMHSGVGKTTLHNIQHHKTFSQPHLHSNTQAKFTSFIKPTISQKYTHNNSNSKPSSTNTSLKERPTSSNLPPRLPMWPYHHRFFRK